MDPAGKTKDEIDLLLSNDIFPLLIISFDHRAMRAWISIPRRDRFRNYRTRSKKKTEVISTHKTKDIRTS